MPRQVRRTQGIFTLGSPRVVAPKVLHGVGMQNFLATVLPTQPPCGSSFSIQSPHCKPYTVIPITAQQANRMGIVSAAACITCGNPSMHHPA